jgi:hypothetical protein
MAAPLKADYETVIEFRKGDLACKILRWSYSDGQPQSYTVFAIRDGAKMGSEREISEAQAMHIVQQVRDGK